MLDIYIDFKSPASYLAMQPTRKMLQVVDIKANWLPYNTRQSAVPIKQQQETKGDTHRRVRAQARQNVHLMYAQLHNLPMQFRDQPGETQLALAALLACGDNSRTDTFIDAAFASYWQQQGDLNDPELVRHLLASSNPEAVLPSSQQAETIVASNQEQALSRGVIDAPAYVFNEQVFVGREHLPWITELLSQTA